MNYGSVASSAELPVMFGPPNTYVASGVHFAGGPNLPDAPGTGPAYLTISALTATDNGFYSFSFWTKNLCFEAGDASSGNLNAEYCVTDPNGRYAPEFKVNSGMDLQINFGDSTGTKDFGATYSRLSDTWHHLLGTVQTDLPAGNKIIVLYVDDVLQSYLSHWDSATSFTIPSNGKDFIFGDDSGGYGPVCDFADVWFAPGVSLLTGSTIAKADRRKFIDGLKRPVDPINFPAGAVLFTGDYNDFATNQGSGGTATLTGSLTAAATHP